jgi:predicted transcriptional regulator
MRTTLTIRLDEDSVRQLDEAAVRTGRSRGAIVRELIRTNLRTTGGGSWEQWRKFAGITDGPADLSTNKAHLKNLGRQRR